MRQRNTSIRARVFVLVLTPIPSLMGLYGFVTYLDAHNAIMSQRGTNFKNEIGDPIGTFTEDITKERLLATLYLGTEQANKQNPQEVSSQEVAAVLAELTPAEAATNKDLKAMADAFASSAAQGAATTAAKNAMAKTLADADGKNSSNAGGFMGLATLEQDGTNGLISIPDARTDYTQLLTGSFQTIERLVPRDA